MLLWTFQDIECLDALKKGIWFKEYTRSSAERIKNVDEKYIVDRIVNGRETTTIPIYCFASIGNGDIPFFGVQLMAQQYNTLIGRMQFDLTRRVLLELWIDDSDILTMHLNNRHYEYEDDENEEVAPDVNITHSDYVQFVREKRHNDDVEALISCVHDWQIISYRTFTYVKNQQGYGTCRVKTTRVNTSLLPTFDCDLFVNGDGYLRAIVDNKIKAQDYNYVLKMQSDYGMKGVYTYMTVEEARYCVCLNTWKAIQRERKSYDWEYDECKDMTIAELFKTKAFILDI